MEFQLRSLKNCCWRHQGRHLQDTRYLLTWQGLPFRPYLATWPAHEVFSFLSSVPISTFLAPISALVFLGDLICQVSQSSVPSFAFPTKIGCRFNLKNFLTILRWVMARRLMRPASSLMVWRPQESNLNTGLNQNTKLEL